MSKRRKHGKLPSIQKRPYWDVSPHTRSRPKEQWKKNGRRNSGQDAVILGRLLTVLISLVFIIVDIRLMYGFSPGVGYILDDYGMGLVVLFACGVGLAEYRLILGRKLYSVAESTHFRLFAISQMEFYSPVFNLFESLVLTYLWIIGIHLLALIKLVLARDLGGWLVQWIAVQTILAVAAGIAVHVLTVGIRYIISRRLDNQMLNQVSAYSIGDDGEIEYLTTDEDEYALSEDNQIEKATYKE